MEPILMDQESAIDRSLSGGLANEARRAEKEDDHEDGAEERNADHLHEDEEEEEAVVGDILNVNPITHEDDDANGADDDDDNSDDEVLPAPVDLGKPRLVAAVTATAAATPAAVEPPPQPQRFTLFHQFQVASLMEVNPRSNRRPMSLPGLRDALQEPRVLRQALRVFSQPRESEMLDGCAEGDFAVLSQRLAQVLAEGLLEPSPQANYSLRLIIDEDLLSELWRLMEQPSPLDCTLAGHFRGVVERLLRRQRDRCLAWMITPQADSSAESESSSISGENRAESIRTLPVFRLLRHLESEDVTNLVMLALEKEVEQDDTSSPSMGGRGRGRGAAAPAGSTGGAAGAKAKQLRWSNKFDLVRVLLHKMRVRASEGEESEAVAKNAAILLCEVLKHSNTHVDLLKNVMTSAPLLFQLALGREEGSSDTSFHLAQFECAWSVLLDLARCLSRIWLPNRQTRIISDTINVFVDNLPAVTKLLSSQSYVRLGSVRMAVAEMAAVHLSGRLVSLFAPGYGTSGLLKKMLEGCIMFPQASLYHRWIFASVLIPMVQNCVPVLSTPDDVFTPAAEHVKELIKSIGLWDFIVKHHFSYNDETADRRNKFAFNGFLTLMANALVSSTVPLPEQYASFVKDGLDWTNTLETTPLSAQVYAARYGGADPKDDSPSGDFDDHSTEEDQSQSSEDDDDHVAGGKRMEPNLNREDEETGGRSRAGRLRQQEPPQLSRYNTPPRPRLPPIVTDSEADAEKQEHYGEANDAFLESNFWSIPIDESLIDDD